MLCGPAGDTSWLSLPYAPPAAPALRTPGRCRWPAQGWPWLLCAERGGPGTTAVALRWTWPPEPAVAALSRPRRARAIRSALLRCGAPAPPRDGGHAPGPLRQTRPRNPGRGSAAWRTFLLHRGAGR